MARRRPEAIWRNILVGSALTSTLGLMTSAAAVAQPKGPTPRLWVAEEPPTNSWYDPDAATAYVGRAPRDAREAARIEGQIDSMLARFPTGILPWSFSTLEGAAFRPAQAGSGPFAPILRSRTLPIAFAGICSLRGQSDHMVVPAAWFDAPNTADWMSRYPELSIAVALGWRQSMHYCRDRAGVAPTAEGLADALAGVDAIASLGGGLGYHALFGSADREGRSWDFGAGGRMIHELGLSRLGEGGSIGNDDSVPAAFARVRRLDRPLFEPDNTSALDFSFWAWLGWSRDWSFLTPLLASRPADMASDASVRTWLDDSLKSAEGAERGLARWLPKTNYLWLSGLGDIPEDQYGLGVFARESWQGAMVRSNAAPGCLPVDLSLSAAAVEMAFTLEPAAGNCIAVRWVGAEQHPDLPPAFSVVAKIDQNGAEPLDALHLAADQLWRQSLTIESRDRTEQVSLVQQVDVIRSGIIVEDARSGEAVKVWEVVLKPDLAYADDRMTIAFTNLHPDGEARTRPMQVSLTVGAGAHEARQQLTAVVTDRQSDPCRDETVSTGLVPQFRPPVPAFHAAALDTDTFSINLTFLAPGQPSLAEQALDCARITVALGGFGGGVESQGPSSPGAICAAQAMSLSTLGTSVMAGAAAGQTGLPAGLEGLVPQAGIDVTLEARGPITGPGSYPAEATASYSNMALEQRGRELPQSITGDGTIVIEQATHGRLKVSYQASFPREPEGCMAQLSGPVSGTFETVVAMPMLRASDRALIAPRPIDFMGDFVWEQLSPAERLRMSAEPRRREAEAADVGGTAERGGRPQGTHTPDCSRMTAEQVRLALDGLLAEVPPELRAALRAELDSDLATGQQFICMMQQMGGQS